MIYIIISTLPDSKKKKKLIIYESIFYIGYIVEIGFDITQMSPAY